MRSLILNVAYVRDKNPQIAESSEYCEVWTLLWGSWQCVYTSRPLQITNSQRTYQEAKKTHRTRSLVLPNSTSPRSEIPSRPQSNSQRPQTGKPVPLWEAVNKSGWLWIGDKAFIWGREKENYLWDPELYRSWDITREKGSLLWGRCLVNWGYCIYTADWKASVWDKGC